MLVHALLSSALLSSTAFGLSIYREEQQILATDSSSAGEAFTCDLPPIHAPLGKDGLPDSKDLFSGKKALKKQVDRLGAAVKVASVCYDDLGDFDEDPRWAPFYDFHKTLADQFPAVHDYAKVDVVNRFGLVYTFQGGSPDLQPVLLTAHQDVVPVPDASTWSYPPFSGHYDGKYLWGRGASDDKSSLIALMSVMEELVEQEWEPTRTVILAFGFDEECSGPRGAANIGKWLEKEYGAGGISIVLDEGGLGLQQMDDVLYALPAVYEKGHLDVWFDLEVNAGHSSIPYPHTGIGIMSEIVTTLESNPYSPAIEKGSPIYNRFVCQARYSPDADAGLTKLIDSDGALDELAAYLAAKDRFTQYRLSTSQAADVVNGGIKINAMPEKTTLGVNYRIAPQDSVESIQHNVMEYLSPIISKYGLSVTAFGEDFTPAQRPDDSPARLLYNGNLTIEAREVSLVTPISPFTPAQSAIWNLFAGTIRHTFAFEDGLVVPTGEIMTGNTDTRHYLNLSQHVYRWSPKRSGSSFSAHTVDERLDMSAHMEEMMFFYDLIRNFNSVGDGPSGLGITDTDHAEHIDL